MQPMGRTHPYKVAGLYDQRSRAIAARQALIDADIAHRQVTLIGPQQQELDQRLEPEGDTIPHTAVRELLTGAGIGGALGIAAVGALGSFGIPLIVAQPLVASALGAAYGAAIGSLAGGARALRMDQAGFSALVKDEVANGHWVLLAHLPDARARDRVLDILDTTAGETRHSR
jgi:hypothetical protein